MSEEEEIKCPYCGAVNDHCEHLFAVRDKLERNCKGGDAYELINRSARCPFSSDIDLDIFLTLLFNVLNIQ